MQEKFFIILLAVFISSSAYAFTDSLWIVGGGGYPGDLVTMEVWLQYEGGGVTDSMSEFDILLTWDAAVCSVESYTFGQEFVDAVWADYSRIDNQGTMGPPAVPKIGLTGLITMPAFVLIPRGTHLAATVDFRILDTATPGDSTCIDTLIEGFSPPIYLGYVDKGGIHTYTPLFSTYCIRVLEHLTILGGPPQIVNESGTVSFVVRAEDADPTHLITLEALYLPVGATFPPVSGYNSVMSTFTWHPGYCDAGVDSAVFHAHCPIADKYATTGITVNNTNRAPTIDGGPDRIVAPGNPLTFTVIGRDQDYSECADDTLTLAGHNLPVTASFIQDSDTTGLFSWTPQEADTGIYTVTFTIVDLAGESDLDDVKINVAYRLDSLKAVVRSFACPGLPEFRIPIVSVNFRSLDRYGFAVEFDPEVLAFVRADTAGTASSGAKFFSAKLVTEDTFPSGQLVVNCSMWPDYPIPIGKNVLMYAVFSVDTSVVPPDTTLVDLTYGSEWPVLVDGYLPIEEICCGDVNGDGLITTSDAIYLLSYIYRGGPPPVADGDVNLDGRISAADANYIITYIYRGGPPPCQPPFYSFFNPVLQGETEVRE